MNADKIRPDYFWPKVEKGYGCWNWTGFKNPRGYGIFRVGERAVHAHRVSWAIHFKENPSALCVCHKCDNPACVRPDHLFLGTHQDNMRDMYAKGRRNAARGVNAGLAKLNPEKVREIRRAKGITQEALARQYGVTHNAIFSVLKRLTWAHVDDAAIA